MKTERNNLELFKSIKAKAGEFGFPKIKPSELMPINILSFNAMNSADKELLKISHVHFFLNDYMFERLWNMPGKYINLLKQARGVIGTDFSCYVDGTKAQNIWNIFRNRLLDHYMQENGIDLIPTAVWGNQETLNWCFDGLPKNATIAVGAFGSTKGDTYYFIHGFERMVKKLKPKTIVVYGELPQALQDKYGNIICNYSAYAQDKWHKARTKRSESEFLKQNLKNTG